MSDQQYGIIREQGEFNDFVPLTEEENKLLNEAAKDKDNKDK